MAGRKIFPQSVRLDEIKTVRYRETRARVRGKHSDMSVFFLFGFRGLGSSGISCRGSLDWRGIPFFLPLLFFWSLACSSPVCRLTMWTLVPCRLAEGSDTHTHTHRHTNWLLPASHSQTLHLRHVCWLHLYSKSCKDLTSQHKHTRSLQHNTSRTLRHGNVTSNKDKETLRRKQGVIHPLVHRFLPLWIQSVHITSGKSDPSSASHLFVAIIK